MWRSVNVFHHDGDRTDLLLDAVRPFVATVAPSVSRVYFQPHWRRGPHGRIPVQGADSVFEAVVKPAVDEILVDYLATHPSTVVLDVREAHEQHVRLAE